MTNTKGRHKKNNGANLGFEEKLWLAADKMRGHMDPAEYKHVALGLIFLKYISDAFEERYQFEQHNICQYIINNFIKWDMDREIPFVKTKEMEKPWLE